MTTRANTKPMLLVVLVCFVLSATVVFADDDSCEECEGTQWSTLTHEYLSVEEFPDLTEDDCDFAESMAHTEALLSGDSVCETSYAAPRPPCSDRSNSCSSGEHCALGYLLDGDPRATATMSTTGEFVGCLGTQRLICFCHCVPVPSPTPSPTPVEAPPSASPTPAKTPTPTPSPRRIRL